MGGISRNGHSISGEDYKISIQQFNQQSGRKFLAPHDCSGSKERDEVVGKPGRTRGRGDPQCQAPKVDAFPMWKVVTTTTSRD